MIGSIKISHVCCRWLCKIQPLLLCCLLRRDVAMNAILVLWLLSSWHCTTHQHTIVCTIEKNFYISSMWIRSTIFLPYLQQQHSRALDHRKQVIDLKFGDWRCWEVTTAATMIVLDGRVAEHLHSSVLGSSSGREEEEVCSAARLDGSGLIFFVKKVGILF